MTSVIRPFTVALPRDSRAASECGFTQVYLAFEAAADGLRAFGREAPRGSLAGVYSLSSLPPESAVSLYDEISRLAEGGGFSGVLLDMPPCCRGFMEKLCPLMDKSGINYFTREAFGDTAEKAGLLVSSAVTKGSFTEALKGMSRKYGPSRLYLYLDRSRTAFEMPSLKEGVFLSGADFRALEPEKTFYSPELLCRYFTYAQKGRVCFVMSDDENTAAEKVKAACQEGFSGFFALWPQWGSRIKYIAGQQRGAASGPRL